MLKVDSYSKIGRKTAQVSLPAAWDTSAGSAQAKKDEALLNQAIHVYRARSHGGGGKTKTRSEINLTKSKWYRQKGTGRARHGAKSAPIFVGGSKAHGPTGEKRELTMPKKMRRKAKNIALTLMVKAKKAVVADLASFKKSADVVKFLKTAKLDSKRFSFVLPKDAAVAKRATKNVENVKVISFEDLNALNVYFGGFLVIDKTLIKPSTSKTMASQRKKSK